MLNFAQQLRVKPYVNSCNALTISFNSLTTKYKLALNNEHSYFIHKGDHEKVQCIDTAGKNLKTIIGYDEDIRLIKVEEDEFGSRRVEDLKYRNHSVLQCNEDGQYWKDCVEFPEDIREYVLLTTRELDSYKSLNFNLLRKPFFGDVLRKYRTLNISRRVTLSIAKPFKDGKVNSYLINGLSLDSVVYYKKVDETVALADGFSFSRNYVKQNKIDSTIEWFIYVLNNDNYTLFLNKEQADVVPLFNNLFRTDAKIIDFDSAEFLKQYNAIRELDKAPTIAEMGVMMDKVFDSSVLKVGETGVIAIDGYPITTINCIQRKCDQLVEMKDHLSFIMDLDVNGNWNKLEEGYYGSHEW